MIQSRSNQVEICFVCLFFSLVIRAETDLWMGSKSALSWTHVSVSGQQDTDLLVRKGEYLEYERAWNGAEEHNFRELRLSVSFSYWRNSGDISSFRGHNSILGWLPLCSQGSHHVISQSQLSPGMLWAGKGV